MSLIIYEGFDYATSGSNNALNGQNGGTGWGEAWSTSGAYFSDILAGSLTYTGLVTVGNYTRFGNQGNGTAYERDFRLFNSIIPNDGNVYWFGFSMAAFDSKNAATFQFDLNAHFDGLGLTTDSAGTTPANILRTGSNASPTDITTQSGGVLFTGNSGYTVHMIMIKISMSGVSTNPITLTYYVDPILANDDSTWTPTQTLSTLYSPGGLGGLGWNGARASSASNGYVRFDEFRIATTSTEAYGGTIPATTGNFFMFMSNYRG